MFVTVQEVGVVRHDWSGSMVDGVVSCPPCGTSDRECLVSVLTSDWPELFHLLRFTLFSQLTFSMSPTDQCSCTSDLWLHNYCTLIGWPVKYWDICLLMGGPITCWDMYIVCMFVGEWPDACYGSSCVHCT